ncbi:hypothetical protein BDV38DRAFT_291781 [Aspergillus pseudotamarii]|uniref:AMP-binding enzyme n=1 Tax=Aspergillus pseudotamarii TaxID=132259 RepID=A0A5N6SWL0_ASPPS|nr:uncharacterized protein BDV38DRAFT_291781 [Aspergillus pseudotamarii]KAE8139066.1 hypothetical protein BDV38DRAFT_291781 [Aspergillus pseudotamarii]
MAMILEPERRLPLSNQDLLSYVFDQPAYDRTKSIYIDAHNPSRSLSWNQAQTIIRQLIKGLRNSGLQNGDCVAVHSLNNIYYSVVVLAVIGAGGIFTGTNPSYTAGELQHHLKTSRSKFVICEPEFVSPLLESVKQASIPNENVWVLDTTGDATLSPGLQSWTLLLKQGECDWVRFNDLAIAKKTTAARFFSSGTTGLPKAVEITHHNLLAQHSLVFEAHPRPYSVSHLIVLPAFHAAIAPLMHIGALRSGYVMYVMRRFELNAYLEFLEKYDITDLIVVPPILTAILKSEHPEKERCLKKVKNIVCGAAPLDKTIQTQVRDLLSNGVPLTQAWGMTETCCASMIFPYPEEDDTGSIGRLVPNVEAKLIDDQGRNISPYNVPGELCIRGPTVTPGYFDNASANNSAFDDDGWLKTGDIASCDEASRKWYIVDRKKELIKVKGFQVAPSEVEAVLLSHPGVADAAVVGARNPGDGTERPCAFIVPKPRNKVSGAELTLYAAQRLAKYKELSGGVRFVEAIPRNASGKILRRVLRDLYEGDGGVKSKL